MKLLAPLLLCLLLSPLPGLAQDLSSKVWNRGAQDCARNSDPPIESFQHDAATTILRQNKCLHYEAPFMYLLSGTQAALLLDTGATPEAERFPLYETVRRLIAARGVPLPLLVAHSHSHGDHKAGDAQFRGQPGTRVVAADSAAVRQQFGFTQWPEGEATLDLGERLLRIIPIPGHQDESIAVYDPRTGWLLTGDSLYPGLILVRDWPAYRASIRRLAAFARQHPVTAILGGHIEMSQTPGELYPVGNQYQPNEASLVLKASDLFALEERLNAAGEKPQTLEMGRYGVAPLGWLPRTLGNVMKWLGLG